MTGRTNFFFLTVTAAGALTAFTAHAEEVIFYAPHTGHVETFDSSSPGRFASSDSPHDTFSRGTRGSITWSVTYGDVDSNTNVGFDDPTWGATRRATLIEVLSYIDSVINASTPVTIEVDVDASQTDGSSFLAAAGTFYFSATGFSVGFAGNHIQTGTDPLGGTADINVIVDFGYNWESDFNNSPSGIEVDLYSVLVHEITHGLGVASLLTSTGVSAIAPNNNPGKFSTVDQIMNLGTGGASPLFNGSAQFIGNLSDLTSNNLYANATNATASLGSNPKIYAPGTFASGSSLSHWDPSIPALMNHSIGAGIEKREFAAFEIEFFKDLGYANAAAPNTAPTLKFTQGQFSGAEGDGTITIGVNLSPASSVGSVSVNYASASGGAQPATAGVDYTDVSNTLTWLIGESGTKTFTVPIADDGPGEPNETVILTISGPTGDAVLNWPTTATMTIIDPANMPMSKTQLLLLFASILVVSSLVIRKAIRH